MDSLQPTWRARLHVYSHWHRAAPPDLMVRPRQNLAANVRFGSKADMCSAPVYVRLWPLRTIERQRLRGCKRIRAPVSLARRIKPGSVLSRDWKGPVRVNLTRSTLCGRREEILLL